MKMRDGFDLPRSPIRFQELSKNREMPTNMVEKYVRLKWMKSVNLERPRVQVNWMFVSYGMLRMVITVWVALLAPDFSACDR